MTHIHTQTHAQKVNTYFSNMFGVAAVQDDNKSKASFSFISYVVDKDGQSLSGFQSSTVSCFCSFLKTENTFYIILSIFFSPKTGGGGTHYRPGLEMSQFFLISGHTIYKQGHWTFEGFAVNHPPLPPNIFFSSSVSSYIYLKLVHKSLSPLNELLTGGFTFAQSKYLLETCITS